MMIILGSGFLLEVNIAKDYSEFPTTAAEAKSPAGPAGGEVPRPGPLESDGHGPILLPRSLVSHRDWAR
jgi:hypothetical protein